MMEESTSNHQPPGTPPVIELVLGVQYAAIPEFTTAHAGWFWKDRLDATWSRAQEVQHLSDRFEKFGDEVAWNFPEFLKIIPPTETIRLQIVNAEGGRMIQVQNSRFHYNWQKKSTPYPSFDVILDEFLKCHRAFMDFLSASGLDVTPQNQWEITYVDHIPKGALWDRPSDLARIFPGLVGNVGCTGGNVHFEHLGSEWRYEISPRRGRLRFVLQFAKSRDKNEEILVLDATARGPIRPDESGWSLVDGLKLGHDAINTAFRDVASPSALAFWGLK